VRAWCLPEEKGCSLDVTVMASAFPENGGGMVSMVLDSAIEVSGCASGCEVEETPSLTIVRGELVWYEVKRNDIESYYEAKIKVLLKTKKPPFITTDGHRARAVLPAVLVDSTSNISQVIIALWGLTDYSLISGPAPDGPVIHGWPRTTWIFPSPEIAATAQYVEGVDFGAEQLIGFRNFAAGMLGGLAVSVLFEAVRFRIQRNRD